MSASGEFSAARLSEQVQAAWETSLTKPQATLNSVQVLLPHIRASGDARLLAFALYTLGRCSFALSDYQGLQSFNEDALEALGDLNDTVNDTLLRGRIHNSLGVACQEFGHYHAALDHFLMAAQCWEDSRDLLGRVSTLTNMSICHFRLGNNAQALETQLEVLALARQHDLAHPIASGQANLLQIYNALQQPEQVLELFPDTLERVRAQGILDLEAEIRREHCVALRRLGHLSAAHQEIETALRLCQEEGTPRAASIQKWELLLELGRVLTLQREYASAFEVLNASLQATEQLNRPELRRGLHEQFAVLHEQRREPALALQHSQKQLAIERQLADQRVEQRLKGLVTQQQVRALQREAELERQRSAELLEKNQALLRVQEQLTYQATHDSLTGVSNRAHFLHRVQETLDALPAGQQAALLFIDLDNFKAVNDLFNHTTGDELLCQVAGRLRQAVPAPHLLGRVGGDEFNVLLCPVASRAAAEVEARHLLNLLRAPYRVQERHLEITASVGCAVAPQDGLDAGTLQGHADLAMFNIKRDRRNDVLLYTPDIQDAYDRRLSLERDLRLALARHELSLHYQGRFTAQDARLVGLEALIRWFHPQHGSLSPEAFIPLAEDTGLILPIGAWVLREACQQAATWDFAGRGLNISVNVSPLQFEQPDFVQIVQNTLTETGLPGHCLILELTETLLLRDVQHAQEHIRQVQALGVQVALDDFGTGYSSLSMLHTLPLDHLKIDQQFLRHLDSPDSPSTSSILIANMLRLAAQLAMSVTAEGVETPQHWAYLQDLHCDHVQGFLLHRPQDATQIPALLNDDSAGRPPGVTA